MSLARGMAGYGSSDRDIPDGTYPLSIISDPGGTDIRPGQQAFIRTGHTFLKEKYVLSEQNMAPDKVDRSGHLRFCPAELRIFNGLRGQPVLVCPEI